MKDDNEEEEAFELRKFKWHCEFGIDENQEKLRLEFTQEHNLKPVKLLITGPPGSGKTLLAKEVSKYYNIPYISILDIIKYGKSLKNELGEEVLKEIEDERQRVFDKLNEEEQKKKKPKELDIKSIREYLPYPTVFKVVKQMLKENVYRNRGYVLDGFPKTYSQSKSSFIEIDEEKEENDPNRERVSKCLPNTVVKLEIFSNDILINRYKSKPQAELENTHYNELDMNRRLKFYRDENESIFGNFSCDEFYKQNQVLGTSIDATKTPKEIYELTKLVIERNGKINNYLEIENTTEKSFKKVLEDNLSINQVNEESQNKINEFYERQQKKEIEQANDIKKKNLVLKEAEVLKSKSKDLQNYLYENVIPILSQGILEICKRCPEDPVDELAMFLMEKSVNVAFKDPSKYKNS